MIIIIIIIIIITSLLSIGDPPKFNAIFREEDMEHGQCICRDGFSFLVISSLSPMEYEKKLEDSIPLGYMKPLYVVNDT